jgi:SAM-dependent methyltransferase
MSTPQHKRCICGGPAAPNPFSEHFDVFTCVECRTQQFQARAGVEAPEFKYDTANDKYNQPAYLHGKELRWSHRELLKLSWQGRKVLEIGCFNGFFLDELRQLGADVYGVDVNLAALTAGTALFRLEGRLHQSIDAVRALGPFDSVVCVDVVEHVDDPVAFIALVSSLLRARGTIHVAGPTLERRFFDKSDYPPHHRWRFSRPGLTRFLENSGYRVTDCMIQYDGLLMLRNWIGKLLNGHGRKEFYGDVAVPPPTFTGRGMQAAYAIASRGGEFLFRMLRIPYCSAVLVATRQG